MELNEALKILRKELCYSQVELATALNMSCPTVNRWEKGKARPNRSTAVNITNLARKKGASPECQRYLEEALLASHEKDLPLPDSSLYSVERESICQLIDEAATGCYVADMETDEMLYANHQAEQYFGKKFVKNSGLRCYQFILGRDTPCEHCPKRHISNADLTEEHVYFTDLDKTFLVQAKSVIWNGKPAHAHYLTDETDALNRQNGFEVLMAKTPVGICTGYVFENGSVELSYFNDGYYEMIESPRSSRNEYTSFSVLKAVCDQEQSSVRAEVIKAFHDRRSFQFDFHIKKTDGRLKRLSMQGRLMEWSPQRAKYYCAVSDIDYLDHRETKDKEIRL